jgi:hypothetical protein
MHEIALEGKFTKAARMGYIARGVIYLVIGGLALLAAFGQGGRTTDSKGALLTIMNQPFGSVLLGLLIIGLLGYTCWRLIQSLRDVDHHGTSAKGLAIRAGLLISAVTHALLAVWATRLLIGDGGGFSGSQASQQGWINSDLGQVALGVAAIAVIVAGLAHIYKGWTAGFEKYMAIPADKNNWARPVCRFGLIARGVVWGIIGWFLIRSAMLARSGEIHGIADALSSLRDNAYGPWLLGIVAAGLFAFGVYSVLEAMYRRIDPST